MDLANKVLVNNHTMRAISETELSKEREYIKSKETMSTKAVLAIMNLTDLGNYCTLMEINT